MLIRDELVIAALTLTWMVLVRKTIALALGSMVESHMPTIYLEGGRSNSEQFCTGCKRVSATRRTGIGSIGFGCRGSSLFKGIIDTRGENEESLEEHLRSAHARENRVSFQSDVSNMVWKPVNMSMLHWDMCHLCNRDMYKNLETTEPP